MKKKVIFCCLLVTVLMSGCANSPKESKPDTATTPDIKKEEPPLKTPEPIKIDLESVDSINVIINKQHDLPSDFVPKNLVKPNVTLGKDSITLEKAAADAMETMFKAAKEEGISLMIGSGYRSYNYQKQLFNNYVNRDGEEAANKYSARPGQSEHQTGLAADLSDTGGKCYLKACFGESEAGKWLNENAYEYGFILRYPKGKEEITGYIYEPWHFRYIGTEEAKKVQESGLVLEEYYNY